MPKKEELGYGLAIVFVLASLFLVILMVPFDTATGAVILDLDKDEAKSLFFGAPFLDLIVITVLAVLIIGGSLEMAYLKENSERKLDELPRMSRIELKEFARESLEAGYNKEDIEEALLAQGWDKEHVKAVIRLY